MICILDLLNNIIIGINELYVCKYLFDLDLTLMNIWRDNYCLENDYDSKTKLSIIFSSCYTNFIEKLLKPQFINKYQNIFDKLINSCHFEFIIPILIHSANQKFTTLC